MCQLCDLQIDQIQADAFGNKLLGILNSGALALMVSVGHRTGLFDAMAGMPASTSQEIAKHAGLNERYVREWLGAMVTGGVVMYDSARKTYLLPAEHAASLTRDAPAGNIGVIAQYIPLMGSVEDDIVECFAKGGGVPYSRYARFHAVMAEDSGQSVLPALVQQILPLAPGLTDKLQSGARVLDIGCGSGRALMLMAKTYPRSTFRGYDLSEEAVSRANAAAAANGLKNCVFEVRDVAAMTETQAYDLITTFDAIHDQANPAKVLANIRAALKPDGVYLMQEIDASSNVAENMDHPIGPALYTISCLHCMTVSLAQGGAGLGAVWGRELANQMVIEAGLEIKSFHRLPHDIQNAYWVLGRQASQ